MILQTSCTPPLEKKFFKDFNYHKKKVENYLSRYWDEYNQQFSYEYRKYRITKTYWHTVNGLVTTLANAFQQGKMRIDGYFFTSYARLAKFGNKAHSRTAKRHVEFLKKRGIIKDVDHGTPGEVHYGFWIRLADWINDALIGRITAAIYETKKQQQEASQQQPESSMQVERTSTQQELKTKVDVAVRTTTTQVVKHIEQRGSTHSIGSLTSYFWARSAGQSSEDSS